MSEDGQPITSAKRWSPYEMHGGTALGIVGQDFVAVASDTRLAAADYTIDCRRKSRIFQLTTKALIVSTGFQGDVEALVARLRAAVWNYQQEHFKELSTESLASYVSNVLYSKRLFPYYTYVMVAGIGQNGRPLLYGYDPVGCIEQLNYDANGTGASLAMPILDLAFGSMHRNTEPFPYPDVDRARDILRDTMCSAAERDIYTGDTLEVAIFTAEGLKIEEYPLPAH
jgi:20S proteasome subunit beta 6